MNRYVNEPTELANSLKEKYGYTQEESMEAARNLVGFFELLLEIDQRNKREAKDKEQALED